MTDLADWLRRQYDDETALVRAADDSGPWYASRSDGLHLHPDGPHLLVGDEYPWVKRVPDGVWLCDDPDDDCESLRSEWMRQAEHIVAWDPARVLAEIDAKRRRLDLHRPDPELTSPHCLVCLTDRTNWTDAWEPDEWPCETIRLDAAPYAGRPGWREEWGTA